MKRLASIITSSALAALLCAALPASQALAADYLDDGPLLATTETEVEYGTGWYIRGDIGYSPLEVEIDQLNVGHPIPLSTGAGFKVGNTIRIEGAASFFGNMEGESRVAADCGTDLGVAVTGECYRHSSFTPFVGNLMLNGYFDLPQLAGFRPYIGAGVGMAGMSFGTITEEFRCRGNASDDCGANAGAGETVLATSTTETSLKFSPSVNVMLGTSYQMSQNMFLDAGYKFTYIGGTRATNDLEPSEGMNISEFRLGVRYEIW